MLLKLGLFFDGLILLNVFLNLLDIEIISYLKLVQSLDPLPESVTGYRR